MYVYTHAMINASQAVDFDTTVDRRMNDQEPRISKLVNPRCADDRHRYFNWPWKELAERLGRDFVCKKSERERERGNSCRNRGLEENQFDGSPLVGVRLAIISEHAEEIIGCSGVPSKTLSLSLRICIRARRSQGESRSLLFPALLRKCFDSFLETEKEKDRITDRAW